MARKACDISQMFQCVYSLTGAVEGDVVKLHGLMLFSGEQASQGQPLIFEANLATSSLHAVSPFNDNATFEGTGVVARI